MGQEAAGGARGVSGGKNAGHQLPSPQVVHITGATDCQQKLQGQPAAETSSSQSSENVPAATSPPVQHQENSHQLAGEETVDDDARREAEAPVVTNLTGGSGTCSQEKQQEHHPAHEAIQQLMQNANPAETRPAQRQTKRSLSPAELRSLAREMGVNLKRAFRHMRTPSGSIDDGDCMWFDEPSSVESCNKRRKTHDGALQDEIAAAYSMLVETAIRITDDDDTRGADGAVVIELCYIPVSLTPELRAVVDPSEMSTKLLVPASYPRSSPVLLEDDDEQRKGIAAGVLDVEFRRAIGQLPEPRSIEGIAKAWDACVRRAVVQFAHGLGGGTFNTRHGRWESCIGAA
ncbi:hypothetical protein ZWY2020_016603 [Hordeum vulgare]|nr:hypothetical protein ZWY2020_016603 [Hordeum vulgare]